MGIDGGERKILSARVVRTIQSIKEIVKDHSDADIYVALQETDMDPNETTQKLLNQDPFHEVRRKKDKKNDTHFSQNSGYRGSTEARKPIEHVDQNIISNPIDHGVPKGGYRRNAGGSREFRVVRDNRTNTNVNEVKSPPLKSSTSTSGQRSSLVSVKGSNGVNQKSPGRNYLPRQAPSVQPASHTLDPQVQKPKVNNPELGSSVLAPTNSVVGVYSSSSDPVHVPSDSKSVANVGAIKRELGAVGVRRQNQGNSTVKPSSAQSYSISNSRLVKNGTSSGEISKSISVNSTTYQPSKSSQPDSVLPSGSRSRPSPSYKYNTRSHQQAAGLQKASQPAKEWKRKSGPKLNANSHGAIGSQTKSVFHPSDSSKDLETEAAHVQDKQAQVDIHHNQNVFIAENIRVSDLDRSRLTFGSFGTDGDCSKTATSGSLAARAEDNPATSISLPTSVPKSPTIETSPSEYVDLADDQLQNSGSNSPSGGSPENLLPDRKDSSTPQNLDNYADIGLAHGNSPSFTHTESQQQQDPAEYSSLPVYDPPSGYDMPYYRTSMDESIRAQSVQSSHEALGPHMTSSIPVSSISMVQQQQQPMPQMYQQLHVSPPFTNLMSYRQIISPVYGQPIPMTGYSGNPAYPHPSNGNNFFMMPGGGSHIGVNNVKYGIQQFKAVPAGGPSGFGNFASPTGYAINAPGVVGGAAGLEESSRLKFKDGNMYLPNPQGETSEMWIQNPREMPNMQSGSYYNMAGQTPHGTYMPPHSGHASFNVAAQSSHMQFPGLYHHLPQAPGLASPHHLGSGGANVAAPGAQSSHMGAYQQPQMSHLNWNANF